MSSRGFTLIELLVASLLGLIVTALALSATLTNRFVLSKDIVRTRLTQNLRGAMDIIGLDARIAGQNFSGSFPAIEVSSGETEADTLIMRRNLIDEVLPVCQTINTSSANQVYFAIPGTVAGCTYAGQTHNYDTWKAYRLANGGSVMAYIYDTSTKLGEFFQYTAETDDGTSYYITRGSGTWANAYNAASSAVYIAEEWKFYTQDEMLKLIENDETSSVQNVSFGITNFKVEIVMQDGTTKTAFTRNDNWTQITGIEVTLTGQENFNGGLMTRSLSSRFFPRNILSN